MPAFAYSAHFLMRADDQLHVQARDSMAKRERWLTLTVVIALVGLIGTLVSRIPGIISYFQRPRLLYATSEITTYPLPSTDGKVFLGSPIKIIIVEIKNRGKTSASDVSVRIPLSASDGFIVGYMTKSEAPSKVKMVGAETKYSLRKLVPGDTVKFDLHLSSVNSTLVDRIGVFDGDGRRATFYSYAPVRYVGNDVVAIIPFRKRWLYTFAMLLAAILLLGVSRMRRSEQPAIAVDGQCSSGAAEYSPANPPASTAEGQRSWYPPPRRWTAGRR